jgi:glycine/D-amino acid oxidase-like deaminating enzyme
MPLLHPTHFVIVGAGAAGLMTARELLRARKTVTILDTRDRCGGRIYPLPAEEFEYPGEGGAEFVRGGTPKQATWCGSNERACVFFDLLALTGSAYGLPIRAPYRPTRWGTEGACTIVAASAVTAVGV